MKKRQKECGISIYFLDGSKNVVHGGGLADIRIKETYILAKSSQLYQNDAPCIIIRTKIMNRVYEELRTFIKEKINGGNKQLFCTDDLPEEFREALDLEDAAYVMAEVT
ncbi:MAG: hypothetical protein IJF37_10560 [Lachnospiraceae bacterium]|nr:hypothetical protein [Lachnospiraceae bacterium]